jgi:hypothetical protein
MPVARDHQLVESVRDQAQRYAAQQPGAIVSELTPTGSKRCDNVTGCSIYAAANEVSRTRVRAI